MSDDESLNSELVLKTHLSEYFKMGLSSNLDTQVQKLRFSFEPWKPVILQIHRVLIWDKNWHPSAILCGTSILFTLLWLCEPNILSIFALVGLFVTVADYLIPFISQAIFKKEITDDEQKLYDEICTNIILYKAKAELLLMSYLSLRVSNPKMYMSITVIVLSSLAWIGATINNLFLLYLLLTFVLLIPGLEHNGMLDKWTGCLAKLSGNLVENAKSRIGIKKNE